MITLLAMLSFGGFGDLVIDGRHYRNVVVADGYYYPGPTGWPELYITTEKGMRCGPVPEPTTREPIVHIDGQAIHVTTLRYWPRLNTWYMETKHYHPDPDVGVNMRCSSPADRPR